MPKTYRRNTTGDRDGLRAADATSDEEFLWRRVLQQAVTDADNLFHSTSTKRNRATEAIGWLLSDDHNFDMVCTLAGANAAIFRRSVSRHLLDRYTPEQIGPIAISYKEKTMLNFIETSGGNAFIRYSVEDNEWNRSSEDGSLQPVDFASAPVLIDIEKIQQGWLKLQSGRDWLPWPNNDSTKVPQPDEKGADGKPVYKQGFSVMFYSTKLFGDEPARELCTSGAGLIKFVQALYGATESGFGEGKVPAVKITGSTKVKMGKGNSRIPTFEVVKWMDRPDELSAASSSSPVAAPTAPPSSQAGASDTAPDEDFGI
jgi:hypothetical protein